MFAVPAALAPVVYGLLNIASATGIVFANKAGARGPLQPLLHERPAGPRTLSAPPACSWVVVARRSRACRPLLTAAAAGAAAASAPLLAPRAACSLQRLRVPLHLCAHARTHSHHVGGHARLPAGEPEGAFCNALRRRTGWVLG